MNIPVYYDYKNAYNGTINPSTIHSRNTGLTNYFRRGLLQKVLSVFKWELPDTWARNYFLYVLYCCGFIAVVNTDKFGIVCQQCSMSGYDIYYQPRTALISNPLLSGIVNPQIGSQCEIIRLQPDYCGILDIVDFYADMLSLSAETAATNLLNSKLSYVFASDGKAMAESFKKLYDNIASGQPAAFVDKNMFNDDGSLKMQFFNQHLKETYIAGDILEDMRNWEMKFDTEIGIATSNTTKKERLITNEMNSAIIESRTKCQLWLEEIQSCCNKVNKMFPDIHVWADWRDENESNNDAYGVVPV